MPGVGGLRPFLAFRGEEKAPAEFQTTLVQHARLERMYLCNLSVIGFFGLREVYEKAATMSHDGQKWDCPANGKA